MQWTILFFVNAVLFGVGLAMDAFSVSLANGLNEPKMKPARGLLISGTFGVFQFAMPLIGWLCVHTIANVFTQFRKFIPWIALILLLYIGGKMLIEGIRDRKKKEDEKEAVKALTFGALIIQGIATSIDALSVGFTISEYTLPFAIAECLIIGIVTFGICEVGLFIGKKVGTKFQGISSIIGGIILILIGVEIFISGIIG